MSAQLGGLPTLSLTSRGLVSFRLRRKAMRPYCHVHDSQDECKVTNARSVTGDFRKVVLLPQCLRPNASEEPQS